MALSRNERANLNRLKACVTPTQRKIDKIKQKLDEYVTKAVTEIKELESQISSYNELIEELIAKDTETESVEVDVEKEIETILEETEDTYFEEEAVEEPQEDLNESIGNTSEDVFPGMLEDIL